MDNWKPVIYRGDGAWIGRMKSGELGVGTEEEVRASLKAAGLRPMWPFMERGLEEFRAEFGLRWGELRTPEFPKLDQLIAATIGTAWRSGSEYWMILSARWLVEGGQVAQFERSLLVETRAEMLASDLVREKVRSSIW
ncbi:hypothetical protein ACFYP0_25310 [Micromonospora arida]|uniref:hypothetical protein n=1 Tax=Micromonospora arida TaxID=2203715 RepID=UPI00368A5B13